MAKNIFSKLAQVQQELKAPKGQYNKFGKYNYRSCEDILEAVKPIAAKHGIFITVGDELVHEGDRFYIKATAKAVDAESGEMYVESAFAREEDAKKGMDGCQVTGTASSYARKYALNGLLCIDDTKDADTNENKIQAEEKAKSGEPAESDESNKKKASPIPAGYPKRDEMLAVCVKHYVGENLENLKKYFKVSDLKFLKNEQLIVAYDKATKK